MGVSNEPADRREYLHLSQVWPFETGFGLEPVSRGTPSLFYVEIWPGVVREWIDLLTPIKDQAQVRAMVNSLAELDTANQLLLLFARPTGIEDESLRRVRDQEDWILGS
jgi:hypothetical protein